MRQMAVKDRDNQAGMVAIMVTLVLMIVVSLIVLGFAQISRRNQRQALDRQLSTQAFYAAETGVNDVAKLIKDTLASGGPIQPKTSCGSSAGYDSLVPIIDAASNVEYTCLLVNPSPASLEYSSVGTRGTVIPLIASSGTISRVTITWRTADDGSTTPANNCPPAASASFSTLAAWNCGYGVLRFEVVPTNVNYNIDTLRTATMSSHVVPLRPGGSIASVNYNTTAANNLVGTACSNTNCQVNIDFPAPVSQYYLRLSALYKDARQVTITATSGGAPVNLTGAQALVDVTGKAQDVLRRIQVRLPLAGSSTNQLSDYGLAVTRPVCKRYSVMDGFFLSEANTVVPGVYDVSPNALCQ